jgi:hypothetical protein
MSADRLLALRRGGPIVTALTLIAGMTLGRSTHRLAFAQGQSRPEASTAAIEGTIVVLPARAGLVPPAGAGEVLQDRIEASLPTSSELKLLSWTSLRSEIMGAEQTLSPKEAFVDNHLATLRTLHLQQQFQAMIAKLRWLEREHLEALTQPSRARQAAALSRLVGIAHHALGDLRAAQERFQLALALAPDAELDPALYPPRVVALFRRAQAERANEASVSMQIRGAPRGSLLFVDGRPARDSSAVHVLRGLHYFRFVCPGYEAKAELTRVTSGQQRLNVQLQRLPSGPAPMRHHLRQLLTAQQLNPTAPSHIRFVGRTVGAAFVLSWHLSDDHALRVGLLRTEDGKLLRQVTLGTERAGEAWALLHATTLAESAPAEKSRGRPLWKRWWFWTIGGTLLAGTAAALAVAFAPGEPVLNVRVR